ncbi:hypothetical protein F5X96DRAFT_680253 [Biscogniauxia mediterranea]|nr:hypothetical protein F5X96DRAFT_680253 [Biscogniauxia mediterranea]
MEPANTTSAATTDSKHKKIRRRHIVPEIGSLYDILHDHAGLSLYVLPICWTDLHMRLLGCRFVQLPPQKTPTPCTTTSPRRSPKAPPTVVTLGSNLDILMSTDGSKPIMTKNRAMKQILSVLFPNHLSRPKAGADLPIHFGRRYYGKAIRCQAIWTQPDPSAMSFNSATTWTSSRTANQLMASMSVNAPNNAPILVYVSRSHLNHVRRNCFRVLSGPNRSYNGPVHRLQMLRSKSLMPKNLDEDSYFVAVMIAMAQQYVHGDINHPAVFTPQDVKVRVLTVSEDDSAFIVYSGTVSAGLLTMFHQPHKAPVGDVGINIEHVQVPIWPVLGLKERLGQALGSDLVGDFDGVPMDTYEDELRPTPESTPPSPKRRREVLTEVFNASFSEDRDSDCPGDTILGKRRCLEEGRVGVVR